MKLTAIRLRRATIFNNILNNNRLSVATPDSSGGLRHTCDNLRQMIPATLKKHLFTCLSILSKRVACRNPLVYEKNKKSTK